MKSLIDKWQARHADALLAQALREAQDPAPRFTLRYGIGYLYASLIVASSYLVMGLGVLLILVSFFSWGALIVGGILILFGYVLLPKKVKNTRHTYRRSDLPQLFALLDQISDQLQTKAPDGVHVIDECNAYMADYRRPKEWVLGIGLPFWTALSNPQRVALLAHEMAHKVNDDPLRHGMFRGA